MPRRGRASSRRAVRRDGVRRRGVGRALALLAAASIAACGDDGSAPGPLEPVETTGAISGRVTAAGGEAVVGALVATNPASAVALTDAAGNYQLSDLAPGSYAVVAIAEGLSEGAGSALVEAGGTATVDLQLAPRRPADSTGAASGLVLRRNGDAVPEGTVVSLLRDASTCEGGAPPAASAPTDAAGRFVASGLPPGAWLACVTVELGGVTFAGRAAFAVDVGRITRVDVEVGRDTGQSTDPDVEGALGS